MPKKSRRTKARQRSRPVGAVQERAPATGQMGTPRQAPGRVPPGSPDSSGRYQHVIPEIKRIAIIAGAIILVLIILSIALG